MLTQVRSSPHGSAKGGVGVAFGAVANSAAQALAVRDADQRGTAVVESTFAIVMLMLLALGAIEVAFALYGRNVVMASAHEGARAAAELGRDPEEAAAIARATVQRAAGGVVGDLAVGVHVVDAGTTSIVQVRVRATVDALGPVPFPIPVDARASVATDEVPR